MLPEQVSFRQCKNKLGNSVRAILCFAREAERENAVDEMSPRASHGV